MRRLIGGVLALSCIVSGARSQESPAGSVEPKPSITVNYWPLLNERALAVPEAERAWPVIRDAFIEHIEGGKLPEFLDPTDQGGLAQLSVSDVVDIRALQVDSDDMFFLSPREVQALAIRWLDEHKEFLSALRKASQMPALGYIVSDISDPVLAEAQAKWNGKTYVPKVPATNPMLFAGLMPHLPLLRQGAAALVADAELAFAEEDGNRVRDDLLAAERIAQFSAESGFVIGQLLSERLQRSCCDFAMTALANGDGESTAVDWSSVARAVRKSYETIDFVSGVDAEQLFYHDFAQRAFSDDGDGDGVMTFEGIELLNSLGGGVVGLDTSPSNFTRELVGRAMKRMHVATRAEDRAAYMAKIDAEREILALPEWTREDMDRPQRNFEQHSRMDPDGDKKMPLALCAGVLAPSFEMLSKRQLQLHCKVNATLLAISLHHHREKHGSWPSALADLDPDFVEDSFIDGFTGKPLLYKLTNDGPIVYSAGADRDDDDARPYEGGTPMPPFVPLPKLSQLNGFDLRAIDGDWILYPPQP